MLLEGLQLPLTTPFYPDGRLNLRKLERNVGAYSKTPAAGIAVLTQHGESSMLSDEETLQILRTAVEAAAAEKVMLAGAFRDSVLGTLAMADHAAKFGYDALLMKQPSFLRMDDHPHGKKELLTYFHAIADRSAIPVVLSSTDAAQGGSLSAELVIELAGHPRIIGLVDAKSTSDRLAALQAATANVKHEIAVTSIFAAVTGRMLARQEPAAATDGMLSADLLTGGTATVAVAPSPIALKTRTRIVGFQILAGSATHMLDGLLAGAVGAMPAFAACAPQACYEIFAAWKDGDRPLAEEKQARLQAAVSRIEDKLGPSGIKFCCDLNGYFGGSSRLPLLPPSGQEREEMEALMHGLRN